MGYDFEKLNNNLDYAKHSLNCLIALFGYKNDSMINYNQLRAICEADCVIEIMEMLKKEIMSK